MSRIAAHVSALPVSATVSLTDRVADLRAAGETIYDLAGGDPYFDTPAHVTAAARQAIETGRTHYAPSAGTPQLRAAVASDLTERGVPRKPSDVVVTASAKYALYLALAATLDPGDEVLIPTPGWVSYVPMVELAHARPLAVPLAAEDGFRLDRARLDRAVTERTRAVLVNSPNNPTGRVLDAEELAALATVAAEHDLLVISDEVYRRLVFDVEHHSPAELQPERTVVIDGVSKAYAMTGWRLGWLAAPSDVAAAALTVQQHTVSCAATFTQDAALAALIGPDEPIAAMIDVYRRRRDELVDLLAPLPGVRLRAPEGAFYVFLDVTDTGLDSQTFAAWLLDTARVAVVPGSAFGPGGERSVRLSMAGASPEYEQAVQRLAAALRGRDPHREPVPLFPKEIS